MLMTMTSIGQLTIMFALSYLLSLRCCTGLPLVGHHMNHKRMKHARIRAIKEEILMKLGLRHEPDVSNVNTTVDERRRMLRMYKKSVEDMYGKQHELFEDDEFFAKRFYSFGDTGLLRSSEEESDTWETVGSLKLHFAPDIPMPEDARKETHVHSAKLKLHKNFVKPSHLMNRTTVDNDVRVNVYMLLGDLPSTNDTKTRKPARRLLDSKIVSLDSTGWEEFNIAAAVQEWVSDPDTNFGVEVSSAEQPIGDLIEFALTASGVHDNEVLPDVGPRVDVYAQDTYILGRQKRSEEKFECVQGDGENRCCRYPLWISFKDIGWSDWVVAPEGYQAYYCDGRCPHRYKIAHNFAAIKSLIYHINPAAAPAPCCMATKLSPITLLHYDDTGRLVVSVYEDMVVNECMCA